MKPGSRVFVAGGRTLLGAALLDLLPERGFENLLGIGSDEPNLADAVEVERFFADERPEYVFLVGGMSGGIGFNRSRPADLIADNLHTVLNVIEASHRHGVTKLVSTGSSCAYPREAPQPLRVESLTTGPLEPTSEAYATAKLAGWKLCDAYRRQYGCRFITAFPANAFGPRDDFDPASGHVIPALIRKMHEARERQMPAVTVWGSGRPRREFIFSRDLADACIFAMEQYEGGAPINLGGGTDLSIAEAARTIAEVVGFRGRIEFDTSKPDGAPLKALDSSVLFDMGWRPATEFRTAIAETYRWFLRASAESHQPTRGPGQGSLAGRASDGVTPSLARPANTQCPIDVQNSFHAG